MKDVTHIFFDLDHTLWDHSRNSRETLEEMVVHFGIDSHITSKEFVRVFEKVNEKLWHKYNQNEIDRSHIRKYRFAQILRTLKLYLPHKPEELSDYFIHHCCRKGGLMPGTEMALNYLQSRYRLGVITNGFDDTQAIKMESSGLAKFFEVVITSESTPYRKPDARIFHHALEVTNATPRRSVMVGDNPRADIRGALDAGLNAVFYNPDGHKRSVCEWQIESLEELIRIF